MTNKSLLQQINLLFNDNFQKHSENLSAVFFADSTHLWLASDESTQIERLSLIDGNNFGEHQQFNIADFIDLPAPVTEEIDIEGIDINDGYLWFMGSHSWKRKKSKLDKSGSSNIKRLATIATEANRYILARIPLVNGELSQNSPESKSAAKLEVTADGNLLMDCLENDPHLQPFIQGKIPSKDNGLDIEGIAVFKNKVFLGLRGPVLRGWAILLEIELELTSPGVMTLKSLTEANTKYKKYFLWLNGLGIRDLCRDGGDLLILGGPTMDLDGPVQIYRLADVLNLADDVMHEPKFVQDIPYGFRDDHAEGMTLCHQLTGTPSLLVVYDSPAKSRFLDNGGLVADIFPLQSI
ncbi:DUF3616 domain-containing protein [Calothrix sp. 336/3]|uniref:DUF3616 domain-containing protein n=1 Tax=Calothrix sp. 336/3 TaxID=1337936 RepID=UPI0004E39035|nr:DUF3616 domain-containing protein [Calothrix sp. 336/3]AKG22930.1 hypothetical protein IJ00_18085 [Calothrix sp. 336/3]